MPRTDADRDHYASDENRSLLAREGHALRLMRRRERITQVELARRVGVARSTIALVERGVVDCCISLWIDLHNALRVKGVEKPQRCA